MKVHVNKMKIYEKKDILLYFFSICFQSFQHSNFKRASLWFRKYCIVSTEAYTSPSIGNILNINPLFPTLPRQNTWIIIIQIFIAFMRKNSEIFNDQYRVYGEAIKGYDFNYFSSNPPFMKFVNGYNSTSFGMERGCRFVYFTVNIRPACILVTRH